MDSIGDGPDTLRINRIEQIPQIKQSHDDNHSSCSICISNFTKNEIILILPCIHKFHRLCIQTWLAKNNTCPTCRERVFDDMDTVSNTDESSDDDIEVTGWPGWPFEVIDPPFHSVSVALDSSDGSVMSDASDQNQSNVSWDDFLSGTDTLGMDAESANSSIAVSDESSDGTDSMNESQITISSSSSNSECSDGSQIVLPVSSDDSSDSQEMQFDSTDSDDSD